MSQTDSFTCVSCCVKIHDPQPLGTDPDGVVGRVHGVVGGVRPGTIGHVEMPDGRHYCLTIEDGMTLTGLAGWCDVETLLSGPSTPDPVAWLRHFIQRDMVRNGDATA